MPTPVTEMPLVHRQDTYRSNDQIIEVDHLVVDAAAWPDRPEARDPAWVSFPARLLVIAYRVRA